MMFILIRLAKVLTVLFVLLCLFNTIMAQDIDELKKAKPISWRGTIGSNATAYIMNGAGRRMNPFHYSFFGSININVKENFDVPLSFSYNQFGFNVDRPFYQLGISPKYKSFQLHLGHRNMHFNSYSLAGHTFFGVGVDYNPGKFRFSAMRGRLRQSILIDQTQVGEFLNPQFKRTGYGFKIGVGTFNNFIDLMLFNAKDDPNSVEGWENMAYQNTISGLTGEFAPAENVVIGLTSKVTLFGRVTWLTEAGGSFYTENTTSRAISDFSLLVTPKSSSVFKWAGKTSLNFNIGPVQMVSAYERILPEYFSMGIYNFINDMENITFSPSAALWQGKVFVSTMIGIQRNNLEGNRSETTRRLINTVNMTIAPDPRYGMAINYTNFTFNQQPQAIILDDSLLIKQVNRSLSLMPYFNIANDSVSQQSINAVFIRQEAEDLNPITRDFGSLLTWMATSSYTYSQIGGMQYTVGANLTFLKSAFLQSQLRGLSLGIGKSLPEKGIQLDLNTQINSTLVDGTSDGSLVNTSLSGNWAFAERHSVRINLNWLRSSSQQFESYNEFIFNLGYAYVIR